MAKVICTLSNASTKINGVTFTADRGQMISDEITDDQAAAFAAIPGYEIVGAKKAPPGKPGKPDDAGTPPA